MNAPWDPALLFSYPDEIEARQLAVEVIDAIEDASDWLDAPSGAVLLFDLRTSVSTRIVAMPVILHVHGQRCNRA